MKHIRLLILLLGLFFSTLAISQISNGGTPYFLQPSILRPASSDFFIDMPSFDLDSLLREDAIIEENMRGSYRFAYKFYTNIDINNAFTTVLQDGTILKQIGIRSAGAYSINLLLQDFEIPPGGKLFIYSFDHSHVIGSFDHRNNSTEKILPIQPVAGESIVVEYSEPSDAPFTGRFTIAEVNHDYRDIFRREPTADHNSYFNCMPDVFCEDVAEENIRSTVLLMINGSIACTGSLLNNTADDGKPYLLTAVHCLVDNTNQAFPPFDENKDHYINRAGTIITFFNYNRPVCDANIKMKGSEEMSLAGAFPRVIASRKDIALLELNDSPPDYYNVYYAGWNVELTASGEEHINLHHPSGAVKKYGMTNASIDISNFPVDYIDDNSHWIIPYWTVGSTYDGSSGSPLFDENQLVIGGLTGGSSNCKDTLPDGGKDYFFALGKAWESDDPTNQLKTYLDPVNKGVKQYAGMDPNEENPVIRLANALYTQGDILIASKLDLPNQGYVFGNSNLKTLEFAEEFTVRDDVEIFGTYMMIPAMSFNNTSGVTVSVYTGDSYPEAKIYSTSFFPRYLNYNTLFDSVAKNLNIAPTETFVVFKDENSKPVPITTKKFFISYSINSTTSDFCVYNTKWNDDSYPNTAWLKDETKGWVPADKYEFHPINTSLAIQPLMRNSKNVQIENLTVPGNKGFYYERSGRVITFYEPLDKNGQIAVYSISGQLLEKFQIHQGKTSFVLKERPKGTIGIVKITGSYFSYTGKIIF